jgi:hypothetical protein
VAGQVGQPKKVREARDLHSGCSRQHARLRPEVDTALGAVEVELAGAPKGAGVLQEGGEIHGKAAIGLRGCEAGLCNGDVGAQVHGRGIEVGHIGVGFGLVVPFVRAVQQDAPVGKGIGMENDALATWGGGAACRLAGTPAREV